MSAFLLAGFSARTDHLVFERGLVGVDDADLCDIFGLPDGVSLAAPLLIQEEGQLDLLRTRHGVDIRPDRRYALLPGRLPQVSSPQP